MSMLTIRGCDDEIIDAMERIARADRIIIPLPVLAELRVALRGGNH